MSLKDQLRADLTTAMKARDEVRRNTLRMVLSAITNEEVAGDVAKQLSDPEIVTVLGREVKKRKESAEAFSSGNRPELAERERAESAVIEAYLPQQLDDHELDQLVRAAIDEVTADTGSAPTRKQLGVVIKSVQTRAAGRADGRRIAGAVTAALSG